jgi:dipeptidyl aminopeptidase/acylaminoacyl peptidase
MSQRIAPYGSWRSPITARWIVADAVGLGAVAPAGADLVWSESRPAEGGRSALVRRRADGSVHDLLPAPWSCRSRVHEYGGGSFTASGDTVYFVEDREQRVLACRFDGTPPTALTAPSLRRHADIAVDARRRRLIAVCEDYGGAPEPVSMLVAIPTTGCEAGATIVAGHDFHAAPRLSPDGARLAWLAWNHPNMPWDETELWVADLDAAGAPRDARRVAGGRGESIFQPEWSPDGVLHFVSDRTGFWNLYRQAGASGDDAAIEALCPREAEFGLPQWAFGMTTYGFADSDRIVCCYAERGEWRLARLDVADRRLTPLDVPFVSFSSLTVRGTRAWFVGGSATAPAALVELDHETGEHSIVRRSASLDLDPGYVSQARAIEFPGSGGRTAYGFYYAPRNRDFAAPPGELPPLRVRSHGGPTSATDGALKLPIQYWTSRGFAVLDVNYSGSTGYGRAYRERLNGRWGIVDVEDCVAGARFLAEQGLADPQRLTISGGSAGGYTTLCALVFHDLFAAGASHYGIGDLAALAADTHKFESRYTDSLVAPWPAGEALYRARSPLHHADRLSRPVIFFQGLDDKVVPPNQAEAMVAVLRAKKLPVAYVAFPGEQHGFRKAENIVRALEAELDFFGRILGFRPSDAIEPVEIENFPRQS